MAGRKKTKNEDTTFTIRPTAAELKEIDKLAAKANMDRSEYMLACADAPERDDKDGEAGLSGREEREMFDLIRKIANKQRALMKPLPAGRIASKDRIEIRSAIIAVYEVVKKWASTDDS
jgi:hypothetical protein